MRRFNHQHAEVWFVVQNAFGRLKGPWHVLRMISAHPSLEVRMQEACAALHNFLEARGGGYDENLDVAMEQLDSTPMVAGGNNSMFFCGAGAAGGDCQSVGAAVGGYRGHARDSCRRGG